MERVCATFGGGGWGHPVRHVADASHFFYAAATPPVHFCPRVCLLMRGRRQSSRMWLLKRGWRNSRMWFLKLWWRNSRMWLLKWWWRGRSKGEPFLDGWVSANPVLRLFHDDRVHCHVAVCCHHCNGPDAHRGRQVNCVALEGCQPAMKLVDDIVRVSFESRPPDFPRTFLDKLGAQFLFERHGAQFPRLQGLSSTRRYCSHPRRIPLLGFRCPPHKRHAITLPED